MKLIYSIIPVFIALLIQGCQSSVPTTKSLEYDHVIAYLYEDLEGGHIVNKMGELHSNIRKTIKLSPEDGKEIETILTSKDSYGGDVLRCFYPRLGIVYYSKEGEVKGHSSICLQCNVQVSKPVIAFEEFKKSGKYGFSQEGVQKILDFCDKTGLGICTEEETEE